MLFCGSKFWDSSVTWDTPNPDFTPCFEKSILLTIPCLYLWLFSPIEGWRVKRSKDWFIPWSWKNTSKLIISAIILLTEIALLITNIVFGSEPENQDTVYGIDYLYPSLIILTTVLQIVFILLHKRKGVQSSGFLFGFWLLFLLLGLPVYRTNFKYVLDQETRSAQSTWMEEASSSAVAEFVAYMIFYPCVIFMLFLNCFADDPPKLTSYPRGKKPNPKLNCSFLSYITFSWLTHLIWKGYRKPLTQDDLWDLSPGKSSQVILKAFDQSWEDIYGDPSRTKDSFNQEPKKPYSLLPVLFRTFRLSIMTGVFLKLIPDLLTFISPLLISLLIDYAENTDIYEWRGYFYAILLLMVVETQTLLNAQQFVLMMITGLRIRTAVTSAVYRKALKISNASKKRFTVGEIVNLMAVDVQRFMDMMGYINALWSAPLQIILCIVFLWNVIGPSAFVGFAVMMILVPLNGFIASKQKTYQIVQMKEKDKRVKLMNEVLNGIKVLKLYAWEPSFIEQVEGVRKKELNVLKRSSYLGALTSFFFSCTPFMVSFFMFMTYVLISPENILTPEIVFVSLSLLNILRIPMTVLPLVIVTLVQATVSLKRINKFINAEDLDMEAVQRDMNEVDPIVIQDGTFSWGLEEEDKPILSGINLRVKSGSLVGVVGAVGSGKSSLCSAILGEMEKNTGRINVNKSVAYVPQQAWMQNVTLKNNVLFGKELDTNLYRAIVNACALQPDLEILPDGDRTEIGEKGINLSGGQKQRVSLARAVYSDAEVFLLDDPLSAVDSHVGKHIFEHVIGPQGLLANKTRILVTHGIGFLRMMDEIVVLKDGMIVEQGTFSQLITKEGDFREFLLQYLTNTDPEEEEEMEVLEEIKTELQKTMGETTFQRQFSQISEDSEMSKGRESMRIKKRKDSAQSRSSRKSQRSLQLATDAKGKGKLITDETTEVGKTDFKVYLYYLKSIGTIAAILSFIFYALSQSFAVGANIVLSLWSENPDSNEPDVRDRFLGIYAAMGIGQSLCILLGYSILTRSTIRGARKLHNALLANVMHSPMSFFDRTPIGRIVNRFSKDVDIMDVLLPMNLRSFLICLMTVLSTYIAIIYATPLFSAVIIPAMVMYILLQKLYIRTSRQLKRIESVTRSPIYSHFGETIQGAMIIRAYGKQDEFILQSEKRVDLNQISYYPNIVSYRWLAVRMETIGNLLTFFAALFTVITRDRGSVTGGDVGLALTYAISVTQILNFLVRMTSDVEMSIVSIERVKEYTEIPQEASWDIPHNKPAKSWPDKGLVEFKDYSTRYRAGLNMVVKNVSCLINSMEKIGIVGRTGAGKSSLTMALLRIIESAEGKIIIDGVDIAKIGLHDLRRRLTIIPQDPILFSGTLRMNLDPFNDFSDAQIWSSLEHSHLKDFVAELPEKLNYDIAEGGENLSVGQRQLVCLGRALLRKSKVLILDEATAAVDLETDDLIQATIRREFQECTVITIAHRLNTIMDSTRVLVLDKGELKEFDSPSELLLNKSSIFYSMAKDAGLI